MECVAKIIKNWMSSVNVNGLKWKEIDLIENEKVIISYLEQLYSTMFVEFKIHLTQIVFALTQRF